MSAPPSFRPSLHRSSCHSIVSLMRDGVLGAFGMEALLQKYGVEMHFGAHEHAYERNYPVYQYQWDSSRTGPEACVDFNRTVHIITVSLSATLGVTLSRS